MQKLWMLLCIALSSIASQAKPVYSWVDESGRTHVSDVVPERYKKSARLLFDSKQHELSSPPRAVEVRDKPKAPASSERPAEPPHGAIGSTTQRPRDTDIEPDCATQLRRYRESQECFAPYIMKGGITKAEGYEKCGPALVDPSRKCGPPKLLD